MVKFGRKDIQEGDLILFPFQSGGCLTRVNKVANDEDGRPSVWYEDIQAFGSTNGEVGEHKASEKIFVGWIDMYPNLSGMDPRDLVRLKNEYGDILT